MPPTPRTMSPDSCHPAERHGEAARARVAGKAVLLVVLYLCIGGPAVSPLAASPLAEAAPPRTADAGAAPGPAEPAPAHNAAPPPDGYFVDSLQGDDRNPGTVGLPWRSLAKAATVALGPGQGLYLRCGRTWRESLTLNARQLADGSIVGGYGAECAQSKAVISGADDFSGGWTQQDSVWSRALPKRTPKITQLFIDGLPLRTAQWPDASPGTARMALLASNDAASSNPNRSPKLLGLDAAALLNQDLVGATVQLRTQAWIIETRRVAVLEGAHLQLDNKTNWDLKGGQGYVLQDKRWMLNSPGEFFHDERAQRLYLIAPASAGFSDLNQTLVEGSVRDKAIVLGKRRGIGVHDIAAMAARDTGMLLTDAPQAVVSRVEASANGLIGIQLQALATDAAASNGISISDSTFAGNGQYGIEADGVSQASIARNTVADTGLGAHRQANVVAAIAAGPGSHVVNNVVAGSGYAGIMFSSRGGSVVARNTISGHCARLADCAGIYSWTGRARREAGQTSRVEGNKVFGGAPQIEGMAPGSSEVVAGIYIDDFSDGVAVVDNLIVSPSVGVFVHNASRVTVRNNRIWLAHRAGLWASMDQTDGDHMVQNVFEANQIVPLVQAEAVAGALPRFVVAQAVWFWHTTGGSAALAEGRNAFKGNSYVQLQGPLASHAWVHGPGAAGFIDALQWRRLNPNDNAHMRPAHFAPVLAKLGDELVANSGFDAGLAHWQSWHSPNSIGFGVKAVSRGTGCVGGCVEMVAGGKGDLLASQAFTMKAGVPHAYRWAALMPPTAEAALGAPYISRDGTPWDSMADAAGWASYTARSAAAGERLDYEAFFIAKGANPARVNVQLETPGLNVLVDSVSVREVLGYTTATPAEWVRVVSAPAAAPRSVGCVELGWPAGCTALDLNGEPVALPHTLPAGSDQLLMRADSALRR